MKYNFDEITKRKNTYSMKYDDNDFFLKMAPDLQLNDQTIRMMLADTDFRCAPMITKRLQEVAAFPTFGYTTVNSDPYYFEAIINWYQKRHDFAIKKEWIIHSNGALDGIEQAIKVFSNPNDGVIICSPVYSNFRSTIQSTNRKTVNCQMLKMSNGCYEMDWEKFESLCKKEENKLYILCSPNNPLGKVWSVDELIQMAQICRENHVILVSDEIHSDIIRKNKKHYPILSLLDDTSNIILISGASKSFNIMGLHCAYCIIPDTHLRERFMSNYRTADPTPFGLAALKAAYNESEDYLEAFNDYIDQAMAFTVNYLHENLPKVKTYIPDGTYILWLDFSEYGYDSHTLQYLINQKANVFVQGGYVHDNENGELFLRFVISSPISLIKETIDRIAKAFSEYEGKYEK